MVLKQLRISRHYSQEQLAQLSGLSVRTIQRVESGHNVSVESLKCLAAALDVDIATLQQYSFIPDKAEQSWQALPRLMKLWFIFNFLQLKPTRNSTVRVEFMAHISGFIFCCLGIVNEAALVGGVMMLASAYLMTMLKWQGDKYGIWYDVLAKE